MKLLEIKNLSLISEKQLILENINFNLNKGEVISLIGPSGAGKSSLLRLLAGLIYPNEGEILLDGKLLSSSKKIVPTGNRNIGLMFQEEVLFPHLSVFKNIVFGLESRFIKNKEHLALEYIKNFGLEGKENIMPASLSGGEKQRVALARILITKPSILLMDEPYSNLDHLLRKDISDFTVKTLKKKNMSVIIVTHDIKEALRISDKVIILKKGKILQIGSPERVYKSPVSKYVASLLGEINQIKSKSNNRGELNTPFGLLSCRNTREEKNNCFNKNHYFVFRPEDLYICDEGIEAKIVNRFFVGSGWEYYISFNNSYPLIKIAPCKEIFEMGQKIKVKINRKSILIFDK